MSYQVRFDINSKLICQQSGFYKTFGGRISITLGSGYTRCDVCLGQLFEFLVMFNMFICFCQHDIYIRDRCQKPSDARCVNCTLQPHRLEEEEVQRRSMDCSAVMRQQRGVLQKNLT